MIEFEDNLTIIATGICCPITIDHCTSTQHEKRKKKLVERLAWTSRDLSISMLIMQTHQSVMCGKQYTLRETMEFQKEYLDLVLVPCGLSIMFAYHLFLLYRYLHRPHTTVMGFENNDKIAWVHRIMQLHKRDVYSALSVLQASMSAATFLASVSLTLCSLIGAGIADSFGNLFRSQLIYGDRRSSTLSIKYISLMFCFLVAFSSFVESSRLLVHGNYLISTPGSDIPASIVEGVVIRAGDFWSVGLRALYFALNLLLWFFGPIPMFASSIIMVFCLHHLDTNSKPLHRHKPLQNQGQMV